MKMGPRIAALMAVLLLALGGADFFLIEYPRMRQNAPIVKAEDTPVISGEVSSSSSRGPVKKGTAKKSQLSVDEVFMSLGITKVKTNEDAILERASHLGTIVDKGVLMKNNDRAALFAWIEDPDAQVIFSAVKQSLQQSFSPALTALSDERIEPEDGAPRDVLSFIDPPGSEKVIIVRIRTRLYEFHIAPGNDNLIESVIDALGGKRN